MALRHLGSRLAAIALVLTPVPALAGDKCDGVMLGLGKVTLSQGGNTLYARCLVDGSADGVFCAFGSDNAAPTHRNDTDRGKDALRQSQTGDENIDTLIDAPKSRFSERTRACLKSITMSKATWVAYFNADKPPSAPQLHPLAPYSLSAGPSAVLSFATLASRVAKEAVPAWQRELAAPPPKVPPDPPALPPKLIEALQALRTATKQDDGTKVHSIDDGAQWLNDLAGKISTEYLAPPPAYRDNLRGLAGSPALPSAFAVLDYFGCSGSRPDPKSCELAGRTVRTLPVGILTKELVLPLDVLDIGIATTLATLLLVAAGGGGFAFGRRGAAPAPAPAPPSDLLTGLTPARHARTASERDSLSRAFGALPLGSGDKQTVRALLADLWTHVDNQQQAVQRLAPIIGGQAHESLDTLVRRAEQWKSVTDQLQSVSASESGIDPIARGQSYLTKASAVVKLSDVVQESACRVHPGFQFDGTGITQFFSALDTLLRQLESSTIVSAQHNAKRNADIVQLCHDSLSKVSSTPLDGIDDIKAHFGALLSVWRVTRDRLPPSLAAGDWPAAWAQLLDRIASLSPHRNLAAVPEQFHQQLNAANQSLDAARRDVETLRHRCEELSPFVERCTQAQALAQAWDRGARPLLESCLLLTPPRLSSATDVEGYFAEIMNEDARAQSLRLAVSGTSMKLSQALRQVQGAGRDDIVALLGFQTIVADLRRLFDKGTLNQIWEDLLRPGLMGGTIARLMRAQMLLDSFFPAKPETHLLRHSVTALCADIQAACQQANVRLTVPAILCPPSPEVEQHFESLPELRAMPEIRERLRDNLARRDPIVVDIHNIGVVAPTERIRAGVVLLNPADW